MDPRRPGWYSVGVPSPQLDVRGNGVAHDDVQDRTQRSVGETHESLEDQELTVWAPPELAVMFGARPEDPRALRVLRAFYGLVHAPRKWYTV